MKKAYNQAQLDEQLHHVGSALEQPVKTFMIGGGTMVFRKQKPGTKDLDLVFETKGECERFAKTLQKIGYDKDVHVFDEAYKAMRAQGIWKHPDGFQIDLFVVSVCNALRLTPAIVTRSTPLGVFGKLDVRMFAGEDVMLFKGITDRPDDEDDIAAIIENQETVDWNAILQECTDQSTGEKVWFDALRRKFENLAGKGYPIPILDQLEMLDDQSTIQGYYDRKTGEGVPENEILEFLRKDGATEKEIKAIKKTKR